MAHSLKEVEGLTGRVTELSEQHAHLQWRVEELGEQNTHLVRNVDELGEHNAYLTERTRALGDEVAAHRQWRETFEGRLPIRLLRRLQRFFG